MLERRRAQVTQILKWKANNDSFYFMGNGAQGAAIL